MPEEAAEGRIGKTAPAERLPYDKHAEEKNHHVDIDRSKGIGQCDLAGEKDRDRSPEHDLPDPQREPAHLSHGDEEKDGSKDDDRDIRI